MGQPMTMVAIKGVNMQRKKMEPSWNINIGNIPGVDLEMIRHAAAINCMNTYEYIISKLLDYGLDAEFVEISDNAKIEVEKEAKEYSEMMRQEWESDRASDIESINLI